MRTILKVMIQLSSPLSPVGTERGLKSFLFFSESKTVTTHSTIDTRTL